MFSTVFFQTFMGQLFGGFCALVGVFTLTLPIPIVVNSFAGCYKNRLWRNEVAQKKRLRVKALKDTNKVTAETMLGLVEVIPHFFALSFILFHMYYQGSSTEDGIYKLNKKRSCNEMTVADMINLTKQT